MLDRPAAIRKTTHTKNPIQSINNVIRKFTGNRTQYPSLETAMQQIYGAIQEASKKWTMPVPKWREALHHFAILLEAGMPKNN